jgi:tRNA pseudouridine32 synthase/23S rRNA pseudouridine746 synthase
MFVRHLAAPACLPEHFPSPFATVPHALAVQAAEDLQRTLPPATEGKMFGVLVVEDAGRIGYLAAFSGMLDGAWDVPGFAPPVFDLAARDAFWLAGERELGALDARLAEIEAELVPVRAALAALALRHDAELELVRARHRGNRASRRAARTAAADHGVALHELAQESRHDTAERKRIAAAHVGERAPIAARIEPLAEAHAKLLGDKRARSRDLLVRIHATYAIANARGERRGLRELFAPAEPPGGAGDCAAPKLLALAYREALRPIALAEFWWGPPPATGGRHPGAYYPACRGKCGPLLAFMLEGLAAEEAPLHGAGRVPACEPRTVYEDEWMVAVEKPPGLLSVPGRSGALRDSVLVRLRARYPDAQVVHRLDLDASGLLLVAKDAETYVALQRLFARREIAKRYIAWLDGAVAHDAGTVELALRVDLDDRPRQIHDPVHGKDAITEWRVIERAAGRTRVALYPRTGRAHQLRVHAAHPSGIGAPIVGDRLYGKPGERLLLHAEALAFEHPRTGQRIALERPAPF